MQQQTIVIAHNILTSNNVGIGMDERKDLLDRAGYILRREACFTSYLQEKYKCPIISILD